MNDAMKSAKPEKVNNAELRVYELLGIKLFKKFILFLERIKHFKDGKQNENYHLKGASLSSVKGFSGYLLYNTVLHIIALCLLALYFCIALFANFNNIWLSAVGCFFVVFNIYCIMLQRYTYLRLKSHILKDETKKSSLQAAQKEKILLKLQNKATDQLSEEIKLIERIRQAAHTGGDCLLTEADLPVLRRISAVVDPKKDEPESRMRSKKSITLAQAIDSLQSKTCVIGSTEKQVAKLQSFLHIKKQKNVLFGFTVVTDCLECETEFKKLFSHTQRDVVETTAELLFSAYSRALNYGEGQGCAE